MNFIKTNFIISAISACSKNSNIVLIAWWKRVNIQYKKCVAPSTPNYIHPPDFPPSVLRQRGRHHLWPTFDSMTHWNSWHSAIAWICCKHLHGLAFIGKNILMGSLKDPSAQIPPIIRLLNRYNIFDFEIILPHELATWISYEPKHLYCFNRSHLETGTDFQSLTD